MKKLIDNGADANHLNLVFMAEGYQASEEAKFNTDVQAKVTAFFADPVLKAQAYKINVYSVFLASQDSGITNPKAYGSQPVIAANTYFGVSFWAYGIQREIAPKSPGFVLTTMEANVPGSSRGNFIPILLCNSPYYGGSEIGSIACCTTEESDSNEVLIHELAGHVIGGVGDEFQGAVFVESWNSTMALPVRWANIYSVIAATRTYGGHVWYVPTDTCKMKALHTPFCPVCIWAINRGIDLYITGSGGTIPSMPTQPAQPIDPLPPATPPVPIFTIPATQKIGAVIYPNPDNYHLTLNWTEIPCPKQYNYTIYDIQFSTDNGTTWHNASLGVRDNTVLIPRLISKQAYQVRMRGGYATPANTVLYGDYSQAQKFTAL